MKFVVRPKIKYSYGKAEPKKDELSREEFLEEAEHQLDVLEWRIRHGNVCQADLDKLDELIAVIYYVKSL